MSTAGMDAFDAPAPETPQLAFQTAEQWVRDWLLPHFRRNPTVYAWDPQWWRYEEVGTVLEAMWGSWEQVRASGDAGQLVAWFRDVFYPLMDRLTGEHGPFWDYNEALGKDKVPPSFPSAPAPPGWFI